MISETKWWRILTRRGEFHSIVCDLRVSQGGGEEEGGCDTVGPPPAYKFSNQRLFLPLSVTWRRGAAAEKWSRNLGKCSVSLVRPCWLLHLICVFLEFVGVFGFFPSRVHVLGEYFCVVWLPVVLSSHVCMKLKFEFSLFEMRFKCILMVRVHFRRKTSYLLPTSFLETVFVFQKLETGKEQRVFCF